MGDYEKVAFPWTDAEVRMLVKRAAWSVLEAPIEPGMGNPPAPVWEVYKPEGVAVLIANAVGKALLAAGVRAYATPVEEQPRG